MQKNLTISIDAMGGDFGPEVVIPGIDIALESTPELQVLLFGNEKKLIPLLDKYPKVREASTIHHCRTAITMDEKPSTALRKGRKISSMWQTIQSIKDGHSGVAISAGNTGALMAMSTIILRQMPMIERPAIAAIWPTLRGESIVLDCGATIDVTSKHLVDFAVMGEAMARAIFGLKKPTVGLLNIGVEEVKGLESVKEAGEFLREAPLPMDYYGFVEGDDIGKGTVDVVVTEGFSGNIALKTAEGTAKQIGEYLRAAMKSSIFSRIGYVFAKGAFNILRKKLDPRQNNGGVFLGLNGIVVKSHGGTDATGFASALGLAIDMAKSNLLKEIETDLKKYKKKSKKIAEQKSQK